MKKKKNLINLIVFFTICIVAFISVMAFTGITTKAAGTCSSCGQRGNV